MFRCRPINYPPPPPAVRQQEPPYYRGGSTISQLVELLWTSDRPVAEPLSYKTHSIHMKQASMPSTGCKPEIPTSKRPQTLAFDRAATGIDHYISPSKIFRIDAVRQVAEIVRKMYNRRSTRMLKSRDKLL
jgi:hypothetical protein